MKRRTGKRRSDRTGAAMVEYIIIVVIVAIAAIAIFGVFGDTIRAKLGGAVEELGGDSGAVDDALSTKSEDWLRNVDAGQSGGSAPGN